MQYQALRKLASSKLMRYAAIAVLVTMLSALVSVWIILAMHFASQRLLPGVVFDPVSYAFSAKALFEMIPYCSLLAWPVVALFLVYTNARSGETLNRAGYTILRVLMFIQALLFAILLPFLLMILDFNPFIPLEAAAGLLLSLFAASALKTAREIVTNGLTYRRISLLLPISLILALAFRAANLVTFILANTLPSLVDHLLIYHAPNEVTFYCVIVVAVMSIFTSVLFLLLCFRSRKALIRRPQVIPEETAE